MTLILQPLLFQWTSDQLGLRHIFDPVDDLVLVAWDALPPFILTA